MRHSLTSTALLLASATIFANAGFSQQYEVIDLDSPGSISPYGAVDINAGGWVTGINRLWDQIPGTPLDLTPLFPSNVLATGVNNYGELSLHTFSTGGIGTHGSPYVYTPSSPTSFLLRTTGYNGGEALDIMSNALPGQDHLVVGLVFSGTYPYTTKGAYWDNWTTWPGLLTTVSGVSRFNSANSARTFVGRTASPASPQAIAYVEGSPIINLHPNPGTTRSSANAINEGGEIIGDIGGQPTIWREDPTSPGNYKEESLSGKYFLSGNSGTAGLDLNNWGMAVGSAKSTMPFQAGDNNRAFVYHPSNKTPNKMLHLDNLIVAGPQVEFKVANSVDERGWIAGRGQVLVDPINNIWESHALVAKPLLSLLPAFPGTAGMTNEFVAFGAESGATIHLAYGLNGAGSSNVCPGLDLDMANAVLGATATSNSNGKLVFQEMIPPQAAGHDIYFQAFDVNNCVKSNLQIVKIH